MKCPVRTSCLAPGVNMHLAEPHLLSWSSPSFMPTMHKHALCWPFAISVNSTQPDFIVSHTCTYLQVACETHASQIWERWRPRIGTCLCIGTALLSSKEITGHGMIMINMHMYMYIYEQHNREPRKWMKTKRQVLKQEWNGIGAHEAASTRKRTMQKLGKTAPKKGRAIIITTETTDHWWRRVWFPTEISSSGPTPSYPWLPFRSPLSSGVVRWAIPLLPTVFRAPPQESKAGSLYPSSGSTPSGTLRQLLRIGRRERGQGLTQKQERRLIAWSPPSNSSSTGSSFSRLSFSTSERVGASSAPTLAVTRLWAKERRIASAWTNLATEKIGINLTV